MNNESMKFIMILFLSIGSPVFALAGDADYTGQIEFAKEGSVSVQKQILEFFPLVYFESEGRMGAPLRVTYVLKNQSEKPQRVDISFTLPEADLYHLKSSIMHFPNHFLPKMKMTIGGKEFPGKWQQTIECKGKRVLAGKTPEDLPEFDVEEDCKQRLTSETSKKELKEICTEPQKAVCRQIKKETGAETCAKATENCKVRRVFQWSYELVAQQELTLIQEYKVLRGMEQYLEATGVVPEGLISSKKIIGNKDSKDILCLKDMGPKWYQQVDSKVYSWNEYEMTSAKNWKTPIPSFELVIHKGENELVSSCFPGLKKNRQE
jgi:hypothetical protein